MLKILSSVMLLGAIIATSSPVKQMAAVGQELEETTMALSREVKLKKLQSKSEMERSVALIEEKMRTLLGSDGLSAERVETIHDFSGNEYLFASFGANGYGILNVANDDVVETAPFAPLPFKEGDEVLYVPWIGYFKREGSTYQDLKDGHELSQDEIEHLKEESSRFAVQSVIDADEDAAQMKKSKIGFKKTAPTNKPMSSGLIYADHEVPYSWYFKRNYDEFPHNDTGICGYVSASMMLAYNELFNSTGYFSSAQSTTYITPYEGSFGPNGWDGVPDLSDSFPKAIWGNGIGDSVPGDIHSAINSFMNGKTKKYDIYDYVWKFATIKDPVKDGCPAAYFGNMQSPSGGNSSGHVVTVYGYYDNGDLLVHYGWEGYSQVVMSELGLFSQGGAVAIYNKSSHVHNNRYFIDHATGKHYCGCGELMS